jgi:L-threonylcarbamoyladenylate synthase
MVSDLEMLKEYAHMNATAEKLVQEFLPGALTLILKAKGGKLSSVAKEDGSVGFRIPDNQFCRDITKHFKKPIVSTSANVSGLPTPENTQGVLEQLKENVNEISLVIDGGPVTKNTPSTIVDVRDEKIKIIREGAVSKDLLRPFL